MKKTIAFIFLMGLLAIRVQAKDLSAGLHSRADLGLESAIVDRVSEDLNQNSDKAEAYGLSSDIQSRVNEMFKTLQTSEKEPAQKSESSHLIYEVTQPLARHTMPTNKA